MGNLGLIPGLGRSPGEGKGYPLQYSPWGHKESNTTEGLSLEFPSQLFLSVDFKSGFPGSSADKESACNAGDPGSIPGSGRSPGDGTGYPLQYSWASLVAQSVKNLLVMQETSV